jgi:DNA-binding HxlR family transcriptional regulator
MAKRTYQQYCPLAYSLDMIGERWTLLIIRELLFGPRRYTDLQEGLPGLGSNLLSQRLKDLEQADIIQRQKLPPPARTVVYELTEAGHDLEPVISALVGWGKRFLQIPPPEGDIHSIMSLMWGLKEIFQPHLAQDINMTTEMHVENEVFRVRVREGLLDIRQGLEDEADLIFHVSIDALLSLFGQVMSPQEAIESEMLLVNQGNLDTVESFWNLFDPSPKT